MPSKVRLVFKSEHGGAEHVALCPRDYTTILKTAGRKLKLCAKALKAARLVNEKTGEELQTSHVQGLAQGTVLIVSTSSQKPSPATETISVLPPPLAPTRRLASTKASEGQEQAESIPAQSEQAEDQSTRAQLPQLRSSQPVAGPSTPTPSHLALEGSFPILEGNVLSLVREAIQGCSCFTETDCGDYIAFDYRDIEGGMSTTFPNPKRQATKKRDQWLLAVRRECRGLLLCRSTGRVLRRPFPKFFNVLEVEESHPDRIPFSPETALLLEKVDGSLVSPLILGEQVVWATRKMLASKLQAFVELHRGDYMGLAKFCILKWGATPLFEWCQAGQAVGVVQHSKSSVTLLAIRDLVTGAFRAHDQVEEVAERFGVPCVQRLQPPSPTPTTLMEWVEDVARRPAPMEGAVLVLPGGQYYKIKTLWYVSMATASKSSNKQNPWFFLQTFLQKRPFLQGVPAQRIWKAALAEDVSNADDARAMCLGLLAPSSEEQANHIRDFCQRCDQSVQALHEQLNDWGTGVREQLANKSTSLDREALLNQASESSGWSRSVLRCYFSEARPCSDALRQELVKQSVEDLEASFGFGWDAVTACLVETATQASNIQPRASESSQPTKTLPLTKRYILRSKCFPTEAFDRPPKGLADHVCSLYLTRRIANYLGFPKASIMGETQIHVSKDYVVSEGKLKGMWEQFAKKQIVDLRIDLQPPGPKGSPVTEHFGNHEWSLWLVRYGPSKLTKMSFKMGKGRPVGEFAGVFLETDKAHRYSDLQNALQCSFNERRLVFLASEEGISKVPDLEDSVDGHVASNAPKQTQDDDSATPWTIYVDLDGVLADFDAALLESSGKRPGDFSNPAAMWRYIMSSERNFFANLPWTEHGHKVWDLVKHASRTLEGVSEVKILTGIPKNGGKSVVRQKQAWCKAFLGANLEVIACSSSEKHRWGGKKRILIDDHLKHCERWEAAGGTFIHYTGNFSRLERQLRGFVYPNKGWSQEELTALSAVRERAGEIRKQVKEPFSLNDSLILYLKGSDSGLDEEFSSAVAELGAEFVGVDCEWRPDELHQRAGARSAASVLQLALGEVTYVIDLVDVSSTTRRTLVALFSPQKPAKWHLVFFGVDGDLPRLLAAVPEIVLFHKDETSPTVLDLQRICINLELVLSAGGNDLISLTDSMEQVAGLRMLKRQTVKASDWASRPLSFDQIQYAACDAKACSLIWEAISVEECLCTAVLSFMTESLVLPSKSHLQKYIRAGQRQDQMVPGTHDIALDLANPALILSAPPTGSVQATYTGIFLNKESSRTLLEAYPPRHRNILADHVTFSYAPDHAALAGLPVGVRCRLRVTEIVTDDKSQVARVSLVGQESQNLGPFMKSPQTLHITMSTAVNVSASRSNEMLESIDQDQSVESEAVNELVLEGTVGLLCELTLDQDMLASVSKSVLQKLTAFAEERQPGSMLKFRGGALSPTERAAVHAFCEARGIQSRSEGPKDSRKMTLTFPKFAAASQEPVGDDSIGRIVESAADLNEEKTKRGKKSKHLKGKEARSLTKSYICVSMDVFTMVEWKGLDQENASSLSVLGQIVFEGGSPEIHIDPERPEPTAGGSDEAILRCLIRSGKLPSTVAGPVVIIMRGLPGSGKSSWASALESRCLKENKTVVIVSADAFFETKGAYEFDPCRIQEAHDFSRTRFAEELENNENSVIIVDNTNAKLSDYQHYLETASNRGRCVVVEILCRSEEELKAFNHRGLHQVPMQNIGRMYGRWESDKSSLMFLSGPSAVSKLQEKHT